MWKSKYNKLFSPFHGGNDTRKTNLQSIAYAADDNDEGSSSVENGNMVFSKPSRFSDKQKWKEEGRALYEQSNSLKYGSNASYIRGDKGVENITAGINKRGVGESIDHGEILKCLGGTNTRFWGDKNGAFCAHYQERSGEGYDMYIQGFFHHGTLQIKVNNVPISERQVKNYSPVYTADASGNEYKITILLIEHSDASMDAEGGGDVLVINEYYVNASTDKELTVQKRGVRFKNSEDRTYKYPLGAMRDSQGNIVVVCKLRGDYRVSSSDQGYFLWKFSNDHLELMRPRDTHYDNHGIYMFRRFGGSAIDDPEYLIVWGEKGDFPFLSYISRYLISRRSTYFNQYKSYDAVFHYDRGTVRSPGQLDMQCIISTNQCNIDSYGIVLSGSHISNVQGITVDGIRYTFYVSRSYKTGKNLGVAMQHEGIYEVIEDFVQIKFSVSSLNVKYVRNNRVAVMLTERDSTFIHVYDIELSQLADALWYRVNSITFDYRFMDVGRFIDIASIGSRVVLPGMKEVMTTLEPVTVVKGQNAGIPVSTTRRRMLRVIQYQDIENFPIISMANDSEEHRHFVSRPVVMGGMTTQSVPAVDSTATLTHIPQGIVLSNSEVSGTLPKSNGVQKNSGNSTVNRVPDVRLKLVNNEVTSGKDADSTSTEYVHPGLFPAAEHGTWGFKRNSSLFPVREINRSGSIFDASHSTSAVKTKSLGNASEQSGMQPAALFATVVTFIVAMAAGIIFLYTWYIKKKTGVTREAHRNAYRSERLRRLGSDSTQLVVRSYQNAPPCAGICEIEEALTQLGCVSTSEL